MNRVQKLLIFLMLGPLAIGCASSTIINSNPEGAQVFIDGQPTGVTPYTHTDKKMVGSSTLILLKKEGYEDFDTFIMRNEEFDAGACMAGVLLVPFLWIKKYKPERTFELNIADDSEAEDSEDSEEPEATKIPAKPVKKSKPAKTK